MTNMRKRETWCDRQVAAIADACSSSDARTSFTKYEQELLGGASSPQ